MSNYTECLTITVPASLADIAAKIGRAMDPDTGGERSFSYNEETDELVCSTPCVVEFKQAAQYMLTYPEMLYESCLRDYQQRWPDHEPVTLEECVLFCSSVMIGE